MSRRMSYEYERHHRDRTDGFSAFTILNCDKKVFHLESVGNHVVEHYQISTEHDIDYMVPIIRQKVYRKRKEENQIVDFELQKAILPSQMLSLWITLGGRQMDVMQAMVMQNLLGITVGASQLPVPKHPKTPLVQRLPETLADPILAYEHCNKTFADPVLHLAHHHDHREETLKCVLCGHHCKDDNDRILHLKFHLSH